MESVGTEAVVSAGSNVSRMVVVGTGSRTLKRR